MIVNDAGRALLFSRLVALAMLFLAGATLARYSSGNPWLNGLTMAAVARCSWAQSWLSADERYTPGMTPYVTFGHFRVPATG